MKKLVIYGSKKLKGEQFVQGSKNACLPIIISTILTQGENTLKRCPILNDTTNICKILTMLGCETKRQKDCLTIDTRNLYGFEISQYLMNTMRSSIIFLGALLARCKEAIVYLPGGCEIGKRPIDFHLYALEKMGVEIKQTGGKLHCKVKEKNLKGATIFLSFPSVGATENIIIAAATADGTTKIINAAIEPEIEDLCSFLNKCGAKIKILKDNKQTIVIEGVEKLHPIEYEIMPDRIVAATLLCAAAATHGEILLKSIEQKHIFHILDVLNAMGCEINIYDKTNIFLKSKEDLVAINRIKTMPHPGFPTDLQPIVMALSCVAKGTTVFVETIFENRFMHVQELKKFGAIIEVKNRVAVTKGIPKLSAANVYATDLRGGAALIVAALCAQGISKIYNISYIDRGYERVEDQFFNLGANIFRK